MNKKSVLLWTIGAILGAIGGYMYFLNYGCQNGCAITSKPINSSLYGAMMGALVLSLFDKGDKKK